MHFEVGHVAGARIARSFSKTKNVSWPFVLFKQTQTSFDLSDV